MSQQADGSYRFIAVANDLKKNISGTSGSIIIITVAVNNDFESESPTGYFRNIKLSDNYGEGKTYDEMSFPITVVKCGDVNGDGEINTVDASYILMRLSLAMLPLTLWRRLPMLTAMEKSVRWMLRAFCRCWWNRTNNDSIYNIIIKNTMKKGCIYSLLLTVLTGQAVAQTVSVADVEAKPGETVSATLEFNAPADTYTGVQFAVQFPALGYSMATNGAVSGWNGSIEYGSMTEGKVKFAAAASKTYETATIAVEFTVATSVAYGEYDVTVTDIQFEGAGIKTGADDVTFKVSVVSAHNVLLDEASTTAPTSATGVNVRVKRTIKANEWSTICLPFAMTEAQVKAAFGDDVQLAEFMGWETTEFDDDDNATAISVSFGDVNAIAANTPYIIKVSKAITEFTADDVDIDPEAEPAVTVGRINRGTFGSFTGSYVPMTIEEGNLNPAGLSFGCIK